MFRLALRTLRAHARRFTSTLLAVTAGVAFLAGVLIMVATFQRSFDDMFTTGTAGTAAVVRADSGIDLGFGESARGQIDVSLTETVAAVDGVTAVAPIREGEARIIAPDGDVIGGGGPPQASAQWITDPDLNPWVLRDGRAPAALDEVVIDAASARQGDISVGDRIDVLTPEPLTVQVVGVAGYGQADSQGPLTTTLFSEEGARAHIGVDAELIDGLLVASDAGLTQTELTAAITNALPDGVEAITGEAYTDEARDIGRDFVGVIRPALLAFAGLALIVGGFSIANTFAIVVAQRTRESALLRALGASRRQIMGSTLLEAGIVGLAGGLIGLVVGIGLATVMGNLIGSFTGTGGSSPAVSPGIVVISLLVGLLITAVAAAVPALRASRIPPIDALREVAVDGGRVGRARTVSGVVMLVGGLALGVQAALAEAGAPRAGLGAVLLLVSVIVLAPVGAGPLVRALGAPIARLRGVTGVMARRNAARSPRRTGATATALIIGVAVVALFTVVASSVTSSLETVVDEQLAGDVIVEGSGGDGIEGIAPSLRDDLAALPEVEASAGIGLVPANLDGSDTLLSFAEIDELDRVVDVGITEGKMSDMTAGTLAVSVGYAEARDLQIGDEVALRHLDGATEDLTVVLLYESTTLAEEAFVDEATIAPHAPSAGPSLVMLVAAEGVTAEQLDDAAEAAATDWPGTEVMTRAELIEVQRRSIDQVLYLIYGLLALSVGIALLGIANTMALSTLERRHELGLLRAVGQTRRQVRTMVRWEAVLVSGIGTLVGLVVGVTAAWMVLTAAANELTQVALPVPTLVVVVAIGAAAGVLASARPASRAAKADVLAAVAAG